MLRSYTVTEVLEDRGSGVELAGFSVFGKGVSPSEVYETAEAAMRAIDRLTEETSD